MDRTEFDGRRALVTGAAGGIGRAVVARLAAGGAEVVAVDQDAEGLARLGSAVTTRRADVAHHDEVEELVADLERDAGPVDLLVNGAGVMLSGPTLGLTPEAWLRTFAVNVHGVVHTSTAVARHMVERGHGVIVTIASNAASVPRMRMAAYNASKAAASAFTKSLGLELAPHGVRCNVVAPGSTDTPMLRGLWTDASGPESSLNGSLADFRTGIPTGRFATGEDVAESVAFLLSDRAAQITMHDLVVDGGATLGC